LPNYLLPSLFLSLVNFDNVLFFLPKTTLTLLYRESNNRVFS